MVHGYGAWLWRMAMTHGAVTAHAHIAAGTVAISGAISGTISGPYWCRFEVYIGDYLRRYLGQSHCILGDLFSLIFSSSWSSPDLHIQQKASIKAEVKCPQRKQVNT